MRRWKLLVVCLSAVQILAIPAAAQVPSDNAALQYWQAFAQMPALDKPQEKLLEDWNKVPLDAAAQKLIAASRQSLMFLRRAAKLPNCDWGLDYNDGISLMLPHIAKAKTLALLAALDARNEFEQGHWGAGREDATAIMTLARHVGRDPILICAVVRYRIEGYAIDLIAPYLPELKANLSKAAAAYEALPAAATLPQGVIAEKKYMAEWLVGKLRETEQRRPGSWRDLWKGVLDETVIPEGVKRVGSFERAVKMTEDLLPVYDELAKLVAAPAGEFDRRYPEFLQRAEAINPMARVLLPAMKNVVAAERRTQARWAMLFAAVAVIQDGPDKLKDIKDPFGTGPFDYRALDQGFELRSKLIDRDQPVTLTVGRAKRD
jgi:hypothetical protein